jgi:2-polyprenyl-3-methyl-5-hydroxy-6-metoxy-1,4-benzoquinol methylase
MVTQYRRVLYEKYFSNQGNNVAVVEYSLRHRQYYNDYFLTRFLPKNKSSRVLDLGCGYGTILTSLKNLGYSEVTGVDCSPEAIEFLHSTDLVENIIQADLTMFLEEANEKKLLWDAVLAIDILEHLTKDELVHILTLIRKVLASTGILIIKVPNAQSPIIAGTQVYGDFTHEIAFTPDSMTQVLRACGFSSVEVYEATPIRYTFMSSLRFYLWQIVRLVYTFLYAVEAGAFDTSKVWTSSFFAVAHNSVCLQK